MNRFAEVRDQNPPEAGRSFCSAGTNSRKLKLIDRFVAGGTVADIGCGNGLYGVYLESMGCRVLQIDCAERRDERARHLPMRIMDAQRLDFPDNHFDHALAFDLIEHLDDDALFLREVRRVCRSRLLLSVPNEEDGQVVRLGLTHVHHKDKTHRRTYRKERLEALLVECGFRVLQLLPNHARLTEFPRALAKRNLLSRLAMEGMRLQCLACLRLGLMENRTVGDWFCVAEKAGGRG